MEVVLITQEHCAFCEDAKRLLDRLAGEYGLAVRELDLNSPEGEAIARDAGVLFPPGILVEGTAVSYGRPSERRLRREFDRRTARRPAVTPMPDAPSLTDRGRDAATGRASAALGLVVLGRRDRGDRGARRGVRVTLRAGRHAGRFAADRRTRTGCHTVLP